MEHCFIVWRINHLWGSFVIFELRIFFRPQSWRQDLLWSFRDAHSKIGTTTPIALGYLSTKDSIFKSITGWQYKGKTKKERDQKTLNKLGICKPLKKKICFCMWRLQQISVPAHLGLIASSHLKTCQRKFILRVLALLMENCMAQVWKKRAQLRCQSLDPWLLAGPGQPIIVKEEAYNLSS